HQGGGDALARDVAEDGEDGTVGELEEVVEIAADLVGGDHAGAPTVVERLAGYDGQQPALELGRQLELLLQRDARPVQARHRRKRLRQPWPLSTTSGDRTSRTSVRWDRHHWTPVREPGQNGRPARRKASTRRVSAARPAAPPSSPGRPGNRPASCASPGPGALSP